MARKINVTVQHLLKEEPKFKYTLSDQTPILIGTTASDLKWSIDKAFKKESMGLEMRVHVSYIDDAYENESVLCFVEIAKAFEMDIFEENPVNLICKSNSQIIVPHNGIIHPFDIILKGIPERISVHGENS